MYSPKGVLRLVKRQSRAELGKNLQVNIIKSKEAFFVDREVLVLCYDFGNLSLSEAKELVVAVLIISMQLH